MEKTILTVDNLSVVFHSEKQDIFAVRNVSFSLGESETLGIVGESGSGKSTLARAIIQLLNENKASVSGKILFQGNDLMIQQKKEMQKIRGQKIGMIFQDPMQGLDPMLSVEAQIREELAVHGLAKGRRESHETAISLMKKVGFSEPESVLKLYPFELSGGMKQRIMIAMALVLKPELLICDEPTTALDVTIQSQIIALLKKEKEKQKLSMLYISHNFGIIAELCDNVCVMYGGTIVERGPVDDIFYHSAHPYTRGLLKSIPQLGKNGQTRLPSMENVPAAMNKLSQGCVFSPRCSFATEECRKEAPSNTRISGNHYVCCHHFSEIM